MDTRIFFLKLLQLQNSFEELSVKSRKFDGIGRMVLQHVLLCKR